MGIELYRGACNATLIRQACQRTLSLDQDLSPHDPPPMHEVVQAVQRERLAVDTVCAMHEGPTPWNEVLRLVEAQQRSS